MEARKGMKGMGDKRKSEVERRELAQRMRGKVRKGSGTPIDGRRLDQMVSVRLGPELVSALRELADETGRSISDLLRAAATNLVQSRQQVTLAVRFDVISTGEPAGMDRAERREHVETGSDLRELPTTWPSTPASTTSGNVPPGDRTPSLV